MPKGLILWCGVQCWWHAPLSEEDTGNNWNDPPPIDKQQLASFIGMVTYIGNFMLHLSHHTEPLLAMLKQEVVFTWDEMANASFQKIKDLIAKTATKPLRYYDWTKLVTVQVDASQRGLGACLLQEGEPIAYASKSLTDTETRYANIERAPCHCICLSVVQHIHPGKALYSGVRP